MNDVDFNTSYSAVGDGVVAGEWTFAADKDKMYEYFVDNPNTTQHAIIFTSAYVYHASDEVPPEVGYLLFYNSTIKNPYALELIRSLDQLVLAKKLNVSSTAIDVALNSYPRYGTVACDQNNCFDPFYHRKFRISGYDVVAANGGTVRQHDQNPLFSLINATIIVKWFFLGPMVTFFHILTEIVGEKESRLRLGMRMMGLKTSVYWLVWFFTGALYILLSTLVLIGAGLACQFAFFVNSNVSPDRPAFIVQ